jgi:superfamily II DNA/RNA helicase
MIYDKLYKLISFQRQYQAVLRISAAQAIDQLEWHDSKEDLINLIDWNNLLGIASVLAQSEASEHLDSSLRIAQTCLSEDTSIEQKKAAALILETLTNKPALKLAIKRGLIDSDYCRNIPLGLRLQACKINFENSIMIQDQMLALNRFQKAVYSSSLKNHALSISAPTSAGKSFILSQIVLRELTEESSRIVYVVPTRALISQVENDFRLLIKVFQLQNVSITTIPQVDQSTSKQIFVFTQERLHWFLTSTQDWNFDVMIIDEAQKIGDGNRGILLQQKIENVVKANSNIKLYFSSPFTSNPEILFADLNIQTPKEKIDTEFISVNQNLYFVTQVPRKVTKYEVSLIQKDRQSTIGTVTLADRPGNSEFKKLAYLTISMGGDKGGNLVYSNGAADTETIAILLAGLLNGKSQSEKIAELIKLVKKTIHKDYTLAKVLEKGVAFHYGNMPLLIRQEIEALFKDGHIQYLVCTSTLLEGVNLPSKSIFIRKPTRGQNKPLNENDFWNLAGRAGRWGKEFNGNIVCIEPKEWGIPPKPSKARQLITRATDEISKRPEEFIKFIKDGSPRHEAEKRTDLEFAFGYYYIKFLDGELDIRKTFHADLINVFEEVRNRLIIPGYILRRNPGISPIAQQTLFEYFQSNSNEIESLIPVYPEDKTAYEEYTRLVGRIGATISNYPPILNQSRALLLINWMQGQPLSVLISKSYANYQKKGNKKGLATVIRETMDNVEEFVRFKFAKDSSCYIDILRYFLELQSKHELLKTIPELNLWLEFGVSQKTHLSLLSLGLTRNSVIEISSFIPNSNMSKEECLQWLKESNYEVLEISPIIKEDIKKVLD